MSHPRHRLGGALVVLVLGLRCAAPAAEPAPPALEPAPRSAEPPPALLDLGDDWAPPILAESFRGAPLRDSTGAPLQQRYREAYTGLANDLIDEEGRPLPREQRNYLELYAVPPSLAVLRARAEADADRPCSAEREALAGLSAQARAPRQALMALAQRLWCEGLPVQRGDEGLRRALRRFQHKHMVEEAELLGPRTLEALRRPPLEGDYLALRRVLRERLVTSLGLLEDGSGDAPDVVEAFTDAALAQLGVRDGASALAFLRAPRPRYAALRLPPRPAYHSPQMELSVVIDRGDVSYDPPVDAEGRWVGAPPRQVLPTLTLYVEHEGRRLALVRWPTTIGGWRTELDPDGTPYLRYKNSDVGPRVLREIVAAPLWLPPESTPGSAALRAGIEGALRRPLASPAEVGPGFRSAYGMVTGYLVEPPPRPGLPDGDAGIRVHGSPDYLSIRGGGYSHGCHRLLNHHAVRLYSFLLHHRAFRALGQQPLWSAQRLERPVAPGVPSRGFSFLLDPPLPVRVLAGRVRGAHKEPLAQRIPKPRR